MTPFGEAPINSGVVGQDDHRCRGKGADRLEIQRMPGYRSALMPVKAVILAEMGRVGSW